MTSIAKTKAKLFRYLMVAALVPGAVIGVTAYAQENADVIRTLRTRSNEAIARHEIETMRSFLSDDFVISVSTGSIERSRDEHIDSFAQHFDQYPDAIYVRTPSSITVSDAYPLAIEQGTWVGTRTLQNGKIESGGEYTAAWKLTGSGWKIYSELYVALYCRGEGC